MREDRQLVDRLWRGDADALRRIYEKYERDLVAVATCLVGDHGAAEDCLQEVFVSIAKLPRNLKNVVNLKSYLVASVANRARSRLRSRARRNAVRADLREAGEVSDAGKVVEAAERKDEALKAFRMLDGLPDEQREVVVMHLVSGLTFAEIGQRLSVKASTVASRYRYAIEKLRTMW